MWKLVLLACAAHVAVGQSCTSSRDCGSGRCCVSATSSYNLVNDPQGPYEMQLGGGSGGQCVVKQAGPGEMCDSDCACQTGYECYRKMTGACCAPRTCITQAEAQADRDFWRCHPPPPRKRSADTPRSALFDALCPQLFPMAPGGGLQPAIAP